MPREALADFHDHHPKEEDFAGAVLDGLSRPAKELPCKFLYDERGSELFDRICRLPEYYPTRTEMALLERHAVDIGRLAGAGCHLVEFGSGASRKVRLLLGALEAPRSYVPIDISRDHLLDSAAALARDFPELPVTAVCADYTRPFRLPHLDGGRLFGFFPGSTIGNFTPDDARAFLAQAAELLAGGDLLLGVDLRKDPAILRRAYDDAQGVTALFNKNLLHRINRELGGDFDPAAFRHEARWNPDLSRMEMHLVSTRDQTVGACARQFHFTAGESIHTENSCKFTLDGFRSLAGSAGFDTLAVWTDPQALFSLHYLRSRR